VTATAPARLRVLFVDDEPRVLDGMRRMLHGLRDTWEMEFVGSAGEALARLRAPAPPLDVVVTDMRMPGMDGGELLERVRAEQPQTVRLVLSGHTDARAVLRSVNGTHQFLAKPCDPDRLRATIDRAFRLRRLLAEPAVQRLAGAVGTLPSVPALYQELLACLQSPNAALTDVGRIVVRDVAMTAKLLQLANSAWFGLPRAVASAERAAAILGLDTLMALVLGHGLFAAPRLAPAAAARVAALWEHSLATAVAARSLATTLGSDSAGREHAFLAGMLHDAGSLLLATGSPLPAATPHAGEAAAERAAHGTSHAELGAYLLGIWGLPDPVVEAVAWHEDPASAGDGPGLATIVHLADRLAAAGGTGDDPADPALGLAPGALAAAGLAARWPELVASVRQPGGGR
jgi:HD-like signal output (HDOD) protein/ActR/RegA family two-component response regulator